MPIVEQAVDDYQLFLEVQSDIMKMLDDYFKALTQLSFNDYKNLTINTCSDLFYTVFMYIKSNLPTENELQFSKSVSEIEGDVIESIQKISNIKHLIHFIPNKSVLHAVNEIKNNLLDIPDESNAISFQTSSQPVPEFISAINNLHDLSPSKAKQNPIKKVSNMVISSKISETFSIIDEVESIVKEGTLLSYDALYSEFQKVSIVLRSKTLCIYNYSTKACVSVFPLQLYFVEDAKLITINDVEYFPILFHSQKNNSIRLFSSSKADQNEWVTSINSAMSRSFLPEKYEILRTLGAGSFGVVKLAKCKISNSLVAIKTICKANVKNSQNLRKEVEILKLCKHPNIVKLHNIVETSKEISLIMEYLSGHNLLQCLNVLYEEGKIRHVIDSLAAALFYIKEFGIIHRDIKLENILFESKEAQSDVKFVDFGLSALKNPNEKSIECLGTLNYAAPELLLKEPYNNSVDIWSLGIVTYAMLFQKLPFNCESDDLTYKAILTSEPSYSDTIFYKRSAQSIDLVKKMLTKNPQNRITVEQILKHPFILQCEHNVRNETTDRLKKFKAFSSSMRNLKNGKEEKKE